MFSPCPFLQPQEQHGQGFSPNPSRVSNLILCSKCLFTILFSLVPTLGFRFLNRILDFQGDLLFELIRCLELPEVQIIQKLFI